MREDGMVRIVELEPGIAAAPQLTEDDFAEVAARGFRAVVDLRPDGESPTQLASTAAAAAARRHGLTFRYNPVRGVDTTDDHVVAAFTRLMHALPRPILFYCGSSTRAATLWAQAAALRLGIDGALAAARAAGYELEVLRDVMEEREARSEARKPAPDPALPTHAA
jgi:sulfide:quinone oxidoreductase